MSRHREEMAARRLRQAERRDQELFRRLIRLRTEAAEMERMRERERMAELDLERRKLVTGKAPPNGVPPPDQLSSEKDQSSCS